MKINSGELIADESIQTGLTLFRDVEAQVLPRQGEFIVLPFAKFGSGIVVRVVHEFFATKCVPTLIVNVPNDTFETLDRAYWE